MTNYVVEIPRGKKSFIDTILNFFRRLGWKFRKISRGEEIRVNFGTRSVSRGTSRRRSRRGTRGTSRRGTRRVRRKRSLIKNL
jgi:hypothetical protein